MPAALGHTVVVLWWWSRHRCETRAYSRQYRRSRRLEVRCLPCAFLNRVMALLTRRSSAKVSCRGFEFSVVVPSDSVANILTPMSMPTVEPGRGGTGETADTPAQSNRRLAHPHPAHNRPVGWMAQAGMSWMNLQSWFGNQWPVSSSAVLRSAEPTANEDAAGAEVAAWGLSTSANTRATQTCRGCARSDRDYQQPVS